MRVALDAPGPALARVLTEGPDLICPNRAELATAVGRDLDSLEQVAQAGRDLVRGGIPMVIVTLGADGAILVTDRATVHARARPVRPVCTLAAGEALLAGVLHGLQHGADPARALATGVAWGTAAVLQPGTRPPGPTDVAATAAALPAGVGGPVARTGQTASPRAGPSVRGHHRWHVPRPARPHHRA